MTYLKAVFPGCYIQGKGVIGELPGIIRKLGARPLLVVTKSVISRYIASMVEELPEYVIEQFTGECCEVELARLAAVAADNKVDVVVGIGGGKVLDSAKIVADRLDVKVVVVPTIASTDAACSGCAILYSDEGVMKKAYFQKRNPDVVLVDSAIIAAAPVRLLVAGMGDALATWFEARSCLENRAANVCGGVGGIAARALALQCYKTLIEDGVAAKAACEKQQVTPELERIIEANTLLSSLGFESGGLAAAHAIHNGLTAIPATHSVYHGEKVAFGVLAGLHLTQADAGEIEQVYTFCERIGLPTTLKQIGIAEKSEAVLKKIAFRACFPGETIHHEKGKITYDLVMAALVAADAMGEERLTRL